VCACVDKHTHHVPVTQPCCGNSKGAVCDDIAQLGSQAPVQHGPSRAGVVGRVQSITKAFRVQIASDLTSALHTPAGA